MHYVRPAVLTNFPESTPVFIQCPNCAKGVPFSKERQDGLSTGGIGHQCPHCERYFAVVTGSCCGKSFLLTDDEWDQLVAKQPLNCPNCGSSLYLREQKEVVLETSFREVYVLHSFSRDIAENTFVEAAKARLKPSDLSRLALYHRTTYERLSLVSELVKELSTTKFHSSLVISNNAALTHEISRESLSSSERLPNLIFQATTTMLSAIESLTHEVNVTIGSPWKERDVDHKKLKGIPEIFPRLRDRCFSFVEQPSFVYLKALRNLSMHRRITTMATIAKYSLQAYGPIRPSAVYPECIYFLPDDPDVEPGKETFDFKREVTDTLVSLNDEARTFVAQLYGLLTEVLIDDELRCCKSLC